MRASLGALLSALLVSTAGCGGRNTRRPFDNPAGGNTSAVAGAAGEDADESIGGSGALSGEPGPSGGSMASDPLGGGGEGHGQAGASALTPAPESGVRFCESARECSGLECRARGARIEHVCVTSCPDGDECSSHQRCVTTFDLEPTCLTRCDWPTDCAYRFDCFDWYDDGQYVCVPAAWLRTDP